MRLLRRKSGMPENTTYQVSYYVPAPNYEIALERVRAYTDALFAVIQEADVQDLDFKESDWPTFVADAEAFRANAG